MLAGNKQDLVEQRAVTEEDVTRVGAELCAGYFATSAKTGAGVEEAFRQLGRLAVSA